MYELHATEEVRGVFYDVGGVFDVTHNAQHVESLNRVDSIRWLRKNLCAPIEKTVSEYSGGAEIKKVSRIEINIAYL